MRIFGSDRIKGLMGRLGMEEGEAIEHGMVSRAIERAQKQVEGRNFEIRKHLLEYDDVMNKQREAIYRLRARHPRRPRGTRLRPRASPTRSLESLVETHCPEKTDPSDWNLTGAGAPTSSPTSTSTSHERRPRPRRSSASRSCATTSGRWSKPSTTRRRRASGPSSCACFERDMLLRVVDQAWKDHLLALDHLKEGIGLRGYGQRDPLNEYKKESYELFQAMKERVEDTVIKTLFRLEPITEEQMDRERQQRDGSPPSLRACASRRRSPPAPRSPPPRSPRPPSAPPPHPLRRLRSRSAPRRSGRNDPCPCGSGKKYKKCHGATVGVGA